MIDNQNCHICLDIPIPLSVQALPRTPPASFHHLGDLSSLQALRDFGKEFDVPRDEIDHACNLASGPADLVVILQRPKTRSSHEYKHPFPKFVGRCETLLAVDELIRFATNGARSIYTVTVLDAFAFKPIGNSRIPDERCHQLLAEILRAKKPKVVIRCHTDKYKDPWMKQFELSAKNYGFVRKELRTGGKHWNTFAELSGVWQLHDDAEEIRQLCTKDDDWDISRRDAPFYLTEALQCGDGRFPGGRPQCFTDLSESDLRMVLRMEAKDLSTMYNWLEYLVGQSSTFGALGIAKAIVFLWKEHFKTNPLYEQVTRVLLFRGSEQQGWFPKANHRLPVEEELSKLQISSSEFSHLGAVVFDSPEIFKNNKRAIDRATKRAITLLNLEEGEEVGKTNRLHTFRVTVCNEIADLIKTQNSLVNMCIRTSTLTQLYGALKV